MFEKHVRMLSAGTHAATIVSYHIRFIVLNAESINIRNVSIYFKAD